MGMDGSPPSQPVLLFESLWRPTPLQAETCCDRAATCLNFFLFCFVCETLHSTTSPHNTHVGTHAAPLLAPMLVVDLAETKGGYRVDFRVLERHTLLFRF